MIARYRKPVRIVLLVAFLATSIVVSQVAGPERDSLTLVLLGLLMVEVIAIGLSS